MVRLEEMCKTKKLTVEEVAHRIGVAPQTFRLGIQQGKFPFACAVQTQPHRFTYCINEERLNLWLEGKL